MRILVLQIEWVGLLFLILFPLIMSDEGFIPLFGISDFLPELYILPLTNGQERLFPVVIIIHCCL